jgi:hypothetical protein
MIGNKVFVVFVDIRHPELVEGLLSALHGVAPISPETLG